MEQYSTEAGKDETNAIFPSGEQVSGENFTGKDWNYSLVANGTPYNTLVDKVYFEPGARGNWHTHPFKQILIIPDGKG